MTHSHTSGAGNVFIAMDGWGHPLHYYYNESEKTFFLISYGADERPDAGLYDSSGRPTLTSVTSTESPEQDLMCKHDLNSDQKCRVLTQPSSSSRNAKNPPESDHSQSLNPHLNDLANSMENAATRQQTTTTRMRRIGSALKSFSDQNHRYPAGSSLQAISDDLAPAFMKDVPQKDGWGNPFRYLVEQDRSNCWLISYGADGTPTDALYDRNGKPTQNRRQDIDDWNDDLIYSCEKGFLRAPAGVE
jgi:hypothetical protein